MCAPVGFIYQNKFLELLVHGIREVWDDISCRGKGDYSGMSLYFLGLGGGPLPSACWVLPERPSNHEPWFTSSRPTPCRAPDLAPGPCNPGAPIPAPSPSRSEAKEAVRGPTDSLTDGQTDGRLPMAAPAEPCAGPVRVPSQPALLSFSGSEISWAVLSRYDTGEERDPPNSWLPGREETCQAKGRGGRPPSPSWS